MKRLLSFAAVAGLALSLSACAWFQQVAGSTTTTDAEKGVQIALTTYADVYQPAVLAYGRLPACPAAPICHDKLIYAKLAAADQAVTKSIVAAQGVLEGTATDTGQLEAAATAIQTAEISIASSGVMTKR